MQANFSGSVLSISMTSLCHIYLVTRKVYPTKITAEMYISLVQFGYKKKVSLQQNPKDLNLSYKTDLNL